MRHIVIDFGRERSTGPATASRLMTSWAAGMDLSTRESRTSDPIDMTYTDRLASSEEIEAGLAMTDGHGIRQVLRRWTARLMWAAVLVFATLVVGGALDARRRLPDLEPWHRIVPRDARAADLTSHATLTDFLAIEDAAFRSVHEQIEQRLDAAWRIPANRYNPDGYSHPGRLGTDWNRTQILPPRSDAIGGALLVHGLTDSPYSMRTLGESLRARGYYVLALRMPGHGTVPAGLTDVAWEDWLAAVRLGARHLRATIGANKPLVLVGYSNGGALVLKYALDVLEGSGEPQADRIVLLSPMVGVAPFAWLTRVISMLGPLPAFEKARWLDVYPEYNPYKYNSFAANAGLQTWRLTTTLQAQIARTAKTDLASRLPPMLTFHSLVDATVSTPAVVEALYDVIADERSELVLFDINRSSGLVPFLRRSDATLLTRLTDAFPRRYRRTLVTNVDPLSLEVAERSIAPGATSIAGRPLGLAWPRDVFSLSHVAIPFPLSDPIYGREEIPEPLPLIRLGLLSPRGERSVLSVPSDTLMRLTCNPFFPYLDARVIGWVAGERHGSIEASAAR
jgi:alpha-beta hydrolase superfamily lysophospholipase